MSDPLSGLGSNSTMSKTPKPQRSLNKNITFYESQEKKDACEPALTSLVLFFGWLYAKKSALEHYIDIYLSRGYDVMFINGNLTNFLWPPSAAHASFELLQVLKTRYIHYNHYLVHAVSIGAFNYTIVMETVIQRAPQFSFFTDKLKGVVFDSMTVGSVDHMVHGIATGATDSSVGRMLISKGIDVYFMLTRKHTVESYEKSLSFIINSPANVPSLILASRNDPMSDPEYVERVRDTWHDRLTVNMHYKMWDKSTHAGHYMRHPEEYVQALDSFLESYKEYAMGNEAPVKSRL